ncbi:MAG: hypothetical protein JWM02_1310 [Frankiales bacterium]|nr:hypothetical protein [Frankiales bacterium]
MARVHVSAGKTLLESYVKTPAIGLCELIWNAFDDDTTSVEVTIEANGLGGVDQIHVTDDGNGMTEERAHKAFSTVGDSWKLMPGTLSLGGRPVHGRYGRGRYAAFSLGNSVTWVSASKAIDGGELTSVRVAGQHSSLDDFDIDPTPNERSSTGTRVTIGNVTPEAAAGLDEVTALRQRLLMEFALHLDRHPDFRIEFLGERIDPAAVMAAKTKIDLEMPEGVDGAATLTIIEWTLENVERRLYLCADDGSILDETSPGVQAPGSEFTAYLSWGGFDNERTLVMDGEEETPAGKLMAAARSELRAHLLAASRQREAEVVKRWKAEGVYPYTHEPKTAVEQATRDTFNLVAMASSRTVDESRSRSSKALALSLLKETFENDPEALLPILQKFAKLPAARIEELRIVLEHTSLSQLITLGREVGNRAEFLNGLNAILFDRQIKRRLLERRQLHRMLAHETWIFGEEWSITGDDERLSVVLKKFLTKLGQDVELANDKPILREDGSEAIPDLVLGRTLETRANHFSHLVIELKRPSHKLTDDDVTQLRSYASAITNDERFDQPNVDWEFWLVGNDTTRSVDEAREQQGLPHGVVQQSKKYKIIVRTWAEVLGDAEHRLKFVQRSLQYESTRDTGLAHMRDKYADFLPASAIQFDEQDEAS